MSASRPELGELAAKWGRLSAANIMVAVGLAGCANQQTALNYSHGHEHFSQAKYGHASPKVVADGQPVPKGGGQYLVGHPYHVAGRTYYPAEMSSYTVVGMASWYGAAFHGRRTANGEVYDMASLTAAHPTMPLPSYARVTNTSNGYSVIVRVNDRGPYHGGRVMDVSSRTADVLGFKGEGTARIKVEYVGRAPIEGSDDGALLASLRTDGSPANLDGHSAPVMVASAAPQETPAPLMQAFFAQSRAATQPVREPTPEPQPEPIRVAAVEPPPEPVDQPAAEPRAEPEPVRAPRMVVAMRQPHGPVPLPPPRPFDLGALDEATVVASSPKPAMIAVLPPRRPLVQASAERALYFSDPPVDRLKRRAGGAFDRLKPVTPTTGD
jgi:rare lipoprotein A